MGKIAQGLRISATFAAVAGVTVFGTSGCDADKTVPLNPSNLSTQVWSEAAGDKVESLGYTDLTFKGEEGDTRLLKGQPGAPSDSPYSANDFYYDATSSEKESVHVTVYCIQQQNNSPAVICNNVKETPVAPPIMPVPVVF